MRLTHRSMRGLLWATTVAALLGACDESGDGVPAFGGDGPDSALDTTALPDDTGDTIPPADCPAEPEPVGYLGATGMREECGIGTDEPKLDVGACQDRVLQDTGLEYCVRANPACTEPDAGCYAVITFNMGPKGLSKTIGGRVSEPGKYGRFVAVGGGSSADPDQMVELPLALREEFPGINAQQVYVLGNSRGTGAISSLLADPDAARQYAAAAVLAGGIKVPEDYQPTNNLHVVFFNGKDDIAEPNGWSDIAIANGCTEPDAPWQNITSADPYVPRGDCTDIAERRDAGTCDYGSVLAYRFKDEGHDAAGYDRHFDPRVRPMKMAFDFYVGRSAEGGLRGSSSACWR